MRLPRRTMIVLAVACLLSTHTAFGWADEGVWVDLMDLDAWKGPTEGWVTAGAVGLDAKNPKALTFETGTGFLINGPAGKAKNLISKESFGDLEMHVEFNLPKGSNSGVKFQSVYEVQIFDSFGSTKKLTGRESGGVYPRSEDKPKYHQIDDGYAPSTNASKAAGEWQVLDLTFLAPRFDASGQKVECARISAVLNGQKVQDNVEVHSPSGSAWHEKEKPTGPILIQGDHGPVTYRNLKIRRLASKS